MLCGGVTTYSPLVQNGAGPGKRIGIVGIGGLGHFGLLWAKALGCKEIVAISRSNAKKEDALKMGMSFFPFSLHYFYPKSIFLTRAALI